MNRIIKASEITIHRMMVAGGVTVNPLIHPSSITLEPINLCDGCKEVPFWLGCRMCSECVADYRFAEDHPSDPDRRCALCKYELARNCSMHDCYEEIGNCGDCAQKNGLDESRCAECKEANRGPIFPLCEGCTQHEGCTSQEVCPLGFDRYELTCDLEHVMVMRNHQRLWEVDGLLSRPFNMDTSDESC